MSMDSVTGAQFLSTLSQCSSPRLESDQMSIKSEDESVAKVKLMCSYGGRIMMRPHDSQLRYIGGDTRILVVSRSISFADLCTKLAKLCGGRSVLPKYKLPYEDYDALVSVICDEDLEAMMEEYDRLDAREAPSKLRLFLFPKSAAGGSMRFDSKSEQSFLEALNNGCQAQEQQQEQIVQMNPSDIPDFLFGLEAIGSAQELILNGTASPCVQKMIMEADSALQSELPQIYTSSNPGLQPLNTTESAETKSRPVSPCDQAAVYQIQQIQQIQQQQQQQQQGARIVAPPGQNILAPVQHILLQPSSQNMLQQILPPRGPKPRNGTSIPSEKKEKGNKQQLENPPSGSPKKIEPKKQNIQQQAEAPAQVPTGSIENAEGLEGVKLADSNRRPVDNGEKKQQEEERTPTTPPATPDHEENHKLQPPLDNNQVNQVSNGNSNISSPNHSTHGSMNMHAKEMSLNVFMEQQKLQEAALKMEIKERSTPPPPPNNNNMVEDQGSIKKMPQQPMTQHQEILLQQQQHQQQQLMLKQQQLLQQQQYQVYQQPYIIENNMVYFLADNNQIQQQQQQQQPPVQFIQQPVHVNQLPMHIQRGASGPLMQPRQPVVALQRQLSAATYIDPKLQQQQQQQQQIPATATRIVYPAAAVTRNGPGAQSPSRFREALVQQQPQQQQQQQQQQQPVPISVPISLQHDAVVQGVLPTRSSPLPAQVQFQFQQQAAQGRQPFEVDPGVVVVPPYTTAA